ncbi:MAG: hypothetical protein Q9173_007389 [Seirophora scorigena]
MIQGGDPTGTGRGGASCFANGKTFADELDGPRKFDRRGVLAMANKGKNTNSSQFFLTYRACPHLARKHTVFGRVVTEEEESAATLTAVEKVEADKENGRPVREIRLTEARVLVDPFEAFLAQEREESVRKEVKEKGGRAEDERVTWTGKRVRGHDSSIDGAKDGGAVGRYLKLAGQEMKEEEEGTTVVIEEWEGEQQQQQQPHPMKKKVKAGGGFGNFDSW